MSKITGEEVRRLAALANIGLSDTEVDSIAAELDRIVGFVEDLQTVDVEKVEPTDQVTGLVDVWRSDEVKQEFSREELMAGAPDQQGGFYKVKRVLGDG